MIEVFYMDIAKEISNKDFFFPYLHMIFNNIILHYKIMTFK